MKPTCLRNHEGSSVKGLTWLTQALLHPHEGTKHKPLTSDNTKYFQQVHTLVFFVVIWATAGLLPGDSGVPGYILLRHKTEIKENILNSYVDLQMGKSH